MANVERYAIFDIDGCLSDDRHRLHLIKKSGNKVTYDDYHAMLSHDMPMNVGLLKSFADNGCTILFLTARPEAWRTATRKWIDRQLAGRVPQIRGGKYLLHMRPNADERPSPEFKADVLKSSPFKWHRVLGAFDDRKDVLDAYEAIGMTESRTAILTYPDANVAMEGAESHSSVLTYHDGDAVAQPETSTAANLMRSAADEVAEGDDKGEWRNVPEVIKALFPEGLPYDLMTQPEWHQFVSMITGLTRFAESDFNDQDAIHEAGVHAFMIESILKGGRNENASV